MKITKEAIDKAEADCSEIIEPIAKAIWDYWQTVENDNLLQEDCYCLAREIAGIKSIEKRYRAEELKANIEAVGGIMRLLERKPRPLEAYGNTKPAHFEASARTLRHILIAMDARLKSMKDD